MGYGIDFVNDVSLVSPRRSRDTLRLAMAGNAKSRARQSHRSEPSDRNGRSEYATFEAALKKVVSVPRSEIQAKLDAEKKHRTSSRAANAKG